MPCFGLHDWLSEPTNGPGEFCPCFSLQSKRIVLLLLMLPFTILLGIIAIHLWTILGFELFVLVIFIIVVLQLLFLLISVPAFFNERKYKLLIPLVIIHVIALAVYVILSMIYMIKLIIVKSSGHKGVRNPDYSVFLSKASNYEVNNTKDDDMIDARDRWNVPKHVLFLLIIQFFLAYVCYRVYIIFRSRNRTAEEIPEAYYMNLQIGRPRGHGISVAEQRAGVVFQSPRTWKENTEVSSYLLG